MIETQETEKYWEDYLAGICLVTLSLMGTTQAIDIH